MTYRIAFFFISIFLSLPAIAQDWLTDLDEAKKLSEATNRPIVLVFQGSDWCAPCIKLDREVWSTDLFKSYAQDSYVMVQADFPRKKQNQLPKAQQHANDQLAERYNPEGIFPLVAILNSGGEVLMITGYKGMSPEAYILHLNSHSS